jgi:serine/threonine protein kinase
MDATADLMSHNQQDKQDDASYASSLNQVLFSLLSYSHCRSVTQLDEAVDIWALGSVFFALLFHVLPFQDGGTLGVLGGNWRAALPKVFMSFILE